ncbi:Spore coat polysaccharide biosynthesis protein spsE [Planctomycetales bacterium 10988]|nr:Spore coat polysaccharide biosynthesis protein spsE [Planctomycetales bacterium 10988]
MSSLPVSLGSHVYQVAPEENGRSNVENCPALIVAEIGQNHNGDLGLAMELIDAAKWAGVDAVKITKRDLDWELATHLRDRPYSGPHSFGATYGEHRRALELSAEAHRQMARRIREHGLLYLGTACDPPSISLLDEFEVDAFKVASRDADNLPLLKALCRRDRPVLLSTGMSSWEELDVGVRVFQEAGVPLLLMQCTSQYPTPWDEVHLRSMQTLRQRYGVPVGFSDHSPGSLLAPVAVAMGACVIEKHLTFDRTAKGSDHQCSLEPEEFRQLVEQVRQVERALGRADKPVSPRTTPFREKLGRSLTVKQSLPKGTSIQEAMLTLKCPGDGIPWQERQRVLGRRLNKSVQAGEMLREEDLHDPEQETLTEQRARPAKVRT